VGVDKYVSNWLSCAQQMQKSSSRASVTLPEATMIPST
jgi:hypothetical protein